MRREGSFLLALAVALVLRVEQLASQILVADEWHALEKAATSSFREIATSFGSADHSIPIALFFRALARTIGLTETGIRLPFLAAGLATVAGLGWGARRLVDRATANAFTWLLAVSPVLVFYSRYARPYALTCPLAIVAVLAFRAWWRGRRSAHAALYVTATAAAGWLHVAVLPFAFTPFAFYGLLVLRAGGQERPRALLRLVRLGLVVGAVLTVLTLPPALLDPGSVGLKTGWGRPPFLSWVRAGRVLLGAPSPWWAAVLGLVAAAGLVRLARRIPETTGLFAAAALVQILTLIVFTPAPRTDTFALARYLLPVAPPILLAAATGFAWIARGVRAAAAAGPALAGLCAGLGPLPAMATWPNDWSVNALALAMLGKTESFAQMVPTVPAFYGELARRPAGSVTLLEAPCLATIFGNPLPLYQRVHRQHTRIGLTSGIVPDAPVLLQLPAPAPGFDLGSFVFLSAALDAEEPPADFLVLHRDLRREIRLGPDQVLRQLLEASHVDVAPIAALFQARFGPPCYEDELLVVFRLRAGAR